VQIPEPSDAIVARRYKPAAIRADGDVANGALVAFEFNASERYVRLGELC
jgi:hypothetical protein